jgi:phenylalanyl-tRNA synthetase beta chain
MKVSYNWLRQYIDIPESPEEIGKVLTSSGLEVEHVGIFETVKGGLKGLVIGHVLTSSKHPNADKLSLTTVDVGDGKPRRIVCGAPNVAAGQTVIVALPGTTVHPLKGNPFEIKLAKIRGEESEGMICAEDEVGLGDSHAGIMILKATVKPGTLASEYFKVESDYTIEIGLTPNRADAASHIGVARDIKACLNREIRWPSVDDFKSDSRALDIPVIVENPEACPRYSAVTISGVTVGESPAWLKQRLSSIGLTPINNIVDITNFVCHEIGQPMHAFDADEITGKKVLVKTLPAGTMFTTLDGKERKLGNTDLMICDGNSEGMCIGGVFGGIRSGIKTGSKNIFLEAACFSPHYIRRTGMSLQLKTDASFRFERGTDPDITVYALKRAAMLIKEIAGGTITSEIIDIYPRPVDKATFVVKQKNLDRLVGKQLPREEVKGILQRLDIVVSNESAEHFTVTVPAYRVDVKQEADIVEEVLRIYGLNNIELSPFSGTGFISGFPIKEVDKYRRSVGEMLTGKGFYEILTNSLTHIKYGKYDLGLEFEPVEILNKLSEENGVLRTTMLFTGLEVCAFNINRKQKNLKLFEFGKVYGRQKAKYFETERLAVYITGQTEADNWRNPSRATSYFDLAQAVAELMDRSGVKHYEMKPASDRMFEYGAVILSGKTTIGRLGKVNASIQKDFGIKQEIFFADLDTALLFTAANPKFDVVEVPKYPEVRRDLSLVLDKHVSYSEIEQLVRSTEKKLVREIVVFDIYEGDRIPQGKKAYALGFTLLDEGKTLTDEEIEKTMSRLISAFESKMQAVIRK